MLCLLLLLLRLFLRSKWRDELIKENNILQVYPYVVIKECVSRRYPVWKLLLGFCKMKHNYYVIPSLENNKTADISYPTWQDANVGTFFFFSFTFNHFHFGIR